MKRSVFIIYCCLQLISASSQNLDYENQIYGLMNELVCFNDSLKHNFHKTIATKQLLEDTSRVFNDTIFTKKDVKLMRMQIELKNNTKWNKNKLNNTRLLSKNQLSRTFGSKRNNGWEVFRKKYGGCLSNYSYPLFSEDSKLCVIYVGTQCDWLMGSGGTHLFEKINGEWIFIKKYSFWVS